MRQQVVILSDHSLFSQGIASRFEQYSERVSLHFVNPHDEDSHAQISAVMPDTVILSAQSICEIGSDLKCKLCDLIAAFPSLRIIQLASDQAPAQLITSQQIQLNEVRDLLDLLGFS